MHKSMLEYIGVHEELDDFKLLFSLPHLPPFSGRRILNLPPIIPPKSALKAIVQKVESPGCPSVAEKGHGGVPREAVPYRGHLPYYSVMPKSPPLPSGLVRISNLPSHDTCRSHWKTFFKPSGLSFSFKENEMEFQFRDPQDRIFMKYVFLFFLLPVPAWCQISWGRGVLRM